MKLYYSPGACSLAPHIVLREAGLTFDLVKTDLKAHQLADDHRDYYPITSKGQVPLLELDSGERLSEGPVISQYIADLAPAKQLTPAAGTMARWRQLEWLNFITSELHKGIGGVFNPAMPEDGKVVIRQRALGKLTWVNEQLEGKPYLMGDAFSIADAYLFTITNWTAHTGIDISGLPNLLAFQGRMAARPAVQAALKAEGLLK